MEMTMNMVDINPATSIIALNIHSLNTLIKRHGLSEWIKKGANFCSLQEMHSKYRVPEIKNMLIEKYTP